MYYLIRLMGFPISFFPYSWIHLLGKFVGTILYLCDRHRRKRALNNLFITKPFATFSWKEKKRIARGSFQNLAITCLELFRLPRSRGRINEILTFDNVEVPLDVKRSGHGMILFAGHQANWEASYIGISAYLPGIAIGKALKNRRLYKWIVSIRVMHGGKLILPHEAMKEGVKALKEGKIFGFVGDQALPQGSYSYPLFGWRAWSTTAPALLSYKTGAPIIVSTIRREMGKYRVHFEEPLYPNQEASLKAEAVRLMDRSMALLEQSILKHPEQWMWQHNRWKQMPINHVKKIYRHDFITVVLPAKNYELIAPHMKCLRTIYPRSFFTFFIPDGQTLDFPNAEAIKTYSSKKELFVNDWKCQFLIDFSNVRGLAHHYKKRSCFRSLKIDDLEDDLTKTLVLEICKSSDYKHVFEMINNAS